MEQFRGDGAVRRGRTANAGFPAGGARHLLDGVEGEHLGAPGFDVKLGDEGVVEDAGQATPDPGHQPHRY
jgi:hypothetical protein